MERKVSQRAASFSATTLIMGWIAVLILCASTSFGYTTKSPEVVQMVKRATAFLKTKSDDRPGGMALIGLALKKNDEPMNEPKMVEAAESVAEAVRGKLITDIYSTGLCLIFLASYDPDKYEAEIKTLIALLQSKQKKHGGWGYDSEQTGDTSMTQYGVLGLWEAKMAGFDVPDSMINRVTIWLLKTQDPSGAWGYQGTPSKNFQLVKQVGVRHTMAAAGAGSIYICATLLGMSPEISASDGKQSALKEIKQEQPKVGKTSGIQTNIDLDLIRAAENRGSGWIQKNYTIRPEHEPYYYMYALERYCTFRAKAEGKIKLDPAKHEGPKWYNDGVNFLKETQKKNGSWDCKGQCNDVVNTALATLFLLRSTWKSVGTSEGFGDGSMVGGMGLPKEGELLARDGQVLKKPLLGPGPALIEAMKQQRTEDLTALVEQFDQMEGTKRPELLTSEHQKRFKALASDPSPEKREAAIRMLVFSGNLDNVPTLILALDDADPGVVETARDGLRRLTRRFKGFGLSNKPTDEERRRVIEQWKAWYLSIRPDTEF